MTAALETIIVAFAAFLYLCLTGWTAFAVWDGWVRRHADGIGAFAIGGMVFMWTVTTYGLLVLAGRP